MGYRHAVCHSGFSSSGVLRRGDHLRPADAFSSAPTGTYSTDADGRADQPAMAGATDDRLSAITARPPTQAGETTSTDRHEAIPSPTGATSDVGCFIVATAKAACCCGGAEHRLAAVNRLGRCTEFPWESRTSIQHR